MSYKYLNHEASVVSLMWVNGPEEVSGTLDCHYEYGTFGLNGSLLSSCAWVLSHYPTSGIFMSAVSVILNGMRVGRGVD